MFPKRQDVLVTTQTCSTTDPKLSHFLVFRKDKLTLPFFKKYYFWFWKKVWSSNHHFMPSIYRATADAVFLYLRKFLSRSLSFVKRSTQNYVSILELLYPFCQIMFKQAGSKNLTNFIYRICVPYTCLLSIRTVKGSFWIRHHFASTVVCTAEKPWSCPVSKHFIHVSSALQ